MRMKLKQILAKVLNTRTSESLQVYDSLDKLNIITFWKILQGDLTENVKLLDENYNPNNKYTTSQTDRLMSVWHNIQDEYYKIQDNPSQRGAMRKSVDYMRMQFRLTTLINHFNFYTEFYSASMVLPAQYYIEKEQQILELFKKLGFTYNLKQFNSSEENIEVIRRFIQSVMNKANRMKDEVGNKAEKEIKNIYSRVASIEQVLERSIGSVSEINVMQWLAYENQAKDIINAKKQLGNGKK